MVSSNDFDDDDSIFSPGTSKRKKLSRASQCKKPKKVLSQSVSAPELDIHQEKVSGAQHCVNCQMPLDLLHRWESAEVHANSCLETDFGLLPDCPDGQNCDNTIRSHYTKFNHVSLASFRDLVSPLVSSSKVSKFVFKKLPSTSSSTDILNLVESDDAKIADNEDILKGLGAPSLDRTNNYGDSNAFSDDDDLFEELTNKALEIGAVKDPEGAIEIQVKVDPNVQLESLVMKIPSPNESRKIDVVGRINSNTKQGTLDSFFGLKPSSSSTVLSTQVSSKLGNHQRRGNASLGAGNRESSANGKQRVCPFYKKIPETSFSVDAFSYGQVPGITHYFLSHFHYDHYGGMTKSWNLPVVCSPTTAKLILLKIRCDKKYLTILSLNKPHVINNVEVTLLDANHCPGSVMFLFKLKWRNNGLRGPLCNGQVILHTGDFRACPEMEEYPALWNNKIDRLYLDTTYCKPEYDFPSQSAVISKSVELVQKHLKKFPKTLVCVGSYTVGKERIFTAIAEAMNSKIWASTEKSRVLKTIADPIIDKRLVSDPFSAQVHVVEMIKVKRKDCLLEVLAKFKDRFDVVLGIPPTGWTHEKGSSSDQSLSSLSVRSLGHKVYQLNVPYSEHSSYGEMKRFVQFLKLGSADRILATVNVGNPQHRNAQKAIFQKWVDETTQPKLDYFLAA